MKRRLVQFIIASGMVISPKMGRVQAQFLINSAFSIGTYAFRLRHDVHGPAGVNESTSFGAEVSMTLGL